MEIEFRVTCAISGEWRELIEKSGPSKFGHKSSEQYY
jgi:hypothetical protein